MQARGALMREHRLIEKGVALLEQTVQEIESTGTIDPVFIDGLVDFISTYADRAHHGKEEEIMFRALDRKGLSPEDRKMMDTLIKEHKFGRETTRALSEARARYCAGDEKAITDIRSRLKSLAALYPHHIEREDKTFFPHSRDYLSDEEDARMLEEFKEFDSHMVHEKYEQSLQKLEGRAWTSA